MLRYEMWKEQIKKKPYTFFLVIRDLILIVDGGHGDD